MWDQGAQFVLDAQRQCLEDSKTYALMTTRAMQDATRATCEIMALSPIPEVSHFAKVT